MRVHEKNGRTDLTLDELCDIGQRLTMEQLKTMKLDDKVIKAEKEAYWRYKAAYDLLKPTNILCLKEIEKLFDVFEKQIENPTRGLSKIEGGSARSYGRSLPPSGTLLIVRYKYKDCRFLVVDGKEKLINLHEKDGPIYNNPSAAACSVTPTFTNGWDFFGIPWKT